MTRVKALFTIFAFSSVCFGATLMHASINKYQQEQKNKEDLCERFLQEKSNSIRYQKAKKLYEESFRLSFDNLWSKANEASQCSCMLVNGNKEWRFQAHNLLK